MKGRTLLAGGVQKVLSMCAAAAEQGAGSAARRRTEVTPTKDRLAAVELFYAHSLPRSSCPLLLCRGRAELVRSRRCYLDALYLLESWRSSSRLRHLVEIQFR